MTYQKLTEDERQERIGAASSIKLLHSLCPKTSLRYEGFSESEIYPSLILRDAKGMIVAAVVTRPGDYGVSTSFVCVEEKYRK